jgi:hypothetical protein
MIKAALGKNVYEVLHRLTNYFIFLELPWNHPLNVVPNKNVGCEGKLSVHFRFESYQKYCVIFHAGLVSCLLQKDKLAFV